jgi:TolB-like protein
MHAFLVGIVAALLPVTLAWAGSVRVAVLPVVVHSSEDGTDYLSEGLSDTLSARLEQAGGIEIVQIAGDARATTKAKVAVEAARSVGADYVVFGSFTQFGEGASLDLRAARVDSVDEDGKPVVRKVFVQSGTVSAIIPRLDDVAGRILHFIRGRPGPVTPPEAPGAAATATSGLEQRVEALERAVFSQQAAETTPEPAPTE